MYEKEGPDTPGWVSMGTQWSEQFHYDGNGNITQLKRYGIGGQVIDDFQYAYSTIDNGTNNTLPQMPTFGSFQTASNKLLGVHDNVGAAVLPNNEDIGDQTGGQWPPAANFQEYYYDDAGNLQYDLNGLNTPLIYIWNHQGKLAGIIKVNNGHAVQIIRFDYDPMGNRIAKHVSNHSPTSGYQSRVSTYYLRDPQGNVLAVYEGNHNVSSPEANINIATKEFHIYGSDRLGLKQVNIPVSSARVAYYDGMSSTERQVEGEQQQAGVAGRVFALERIPLNLEGQENNAPLSELSYDMMHVYHELLSDKWEILEALSEEAQVLKSPTLEYLAYMEPYIRMEERQVNLLERDFRTQILTRTKSLLQAFLTFERAHERERWENYPYGDIEGGISLTDQITAEATGEAILLRSLIFNSLYNDSLDKIVLRNVSQKPLSLQGWTLKNLTTSETFTFGEDVSVGASDTLHLSATAGISLPDDAAHLVLENPDGAKIDEVRYDSSLTALHRYYYTLTAGTELPNSFRHGEEPPSPKPYSFVASATRITGDKVYELKDHLGNVRITLSDVRLSTIFNSALTSFRTEVVSMSDYYAFGMLMVGKNWSAGEYRYGFNGQENDDEVAGVGNQQDYGLRIYDPRLGRFLSVDPLAPEFPWNSNYAFAEDDVIRCVDLDGAERFITTLTFGDDNKPSLNITDIHDIKKRSWNWRKFKWNYYVDNSQQIIEVHTGVSHKGAVNGRLVDEEIKFTFKSVEEVNNALATGGLSKEAIEKQLQFFQNFDLIAAALENVAEEHRLGHVPFSGAYKSGKVNRLNSPIASVSEEQGLLAEAVNQRDKYIKNLAHIYSKKKLKDYTTVIAGVNLETKEIAVVAKLTHENNIGVCAEDILRLRLGGDNNVIRYTAAVRPISGKIIDVCPRCQSKIPKSSFMNGVKFKE